MTHIERWHFKSLAVILVWLGIFLWLGKVEGVGFYCSHFLCLSNNILKYKLKNLISYLPTNSNNINQTIHL